MAALQGLQQIHIATHDSIGTGEDGPTHQPIALPALYRAVPDTLYIRPRDSEEVAGAFITAINATETPTQSSRDGFAYMLVENDDFDVTLIGVGSEMGFTMETKDLLEKEGVKARVVSFPCPRLFEQQSREYKPSVLKPQSGKPPEVIEAYAANGWDKAAYDYFGFKATWMAPKVKELVEEVRRDGIEILWGDFKDLNGPLGVGLEH